MATYKYYKSDFSLVLELRSKRTSADGEQVLLNTSYPFTLKFFSSTKTSKAFNVDELTTYDASYDGTSVKNCKVLDDTHVLVYFDHTQYAFGVGTLYVEWHCQVPDTHFEGDTIQNVKRLYSTGIELTDQPDLDNG